MSQKLDRVLDLQHVLWRNSSPGVHTYGTCMRCADKRARGGGLCSDCALAELTELVGSDIANNYAGAITTIRLLEQDMENKAAGV